VKRVLFFFLICVFLIQIAFSSGGYDHGSPVGKNQLQLDFTVNPFDIFPYGQTYIVWSYGLTDKLDFHGYVSRASDGKTDQIYGGLMYCFFQSERLDLSTALGYRQIGTNVDRVVPQFLYNYKFLNGYTIGGSSVAIQQNSSRHIGYTFDIALYIPLDHFIDLPDATESIHFALGLFKPSTSSKIYPTYSIDIKFNPF